MKPRRTKEQIALDEISKLIERMPDRGGMEYVMAMDDTMDRIKDILEGAKR